jgi:uncharacterized protein (DUF1501 family)
MKRREFIKTTSAAAVAYTMGHGVLSGASEQNVSNIFVILLRGGMDGLAAVQPLRDKELFNIRSTCVVENTFRLDGNFGLHPAMAGFSKHWGSQNASVVHATGFNYYGRSHFEGQNLMEGGGASPYSINTGWLGRAMEISKLSSLAVTLPTPLICRSSAITNNLFPSNIVKQSYEDTNALLENLWAEDAALSKYGTSTAMTNEKISHGQDPERLAKEVARQMGQPGGPKVGFVEYSGFDTHSRQGGEHGDHAKHLQKLDRVISAFASYSKAVWDNTIVITVTEFGRTAKENGTKGTDHGVASAIFLAGGLIKASKVITDWPGLGKKELFERRDLRQTIDARDVYGDVIHHAFSISKKQVREVIFPGTRQMLDLSIWG